MGPQGAVRGFGVCGCVFGSGKAPAVSSPGAPVCCKRYIHLHPSNIDSNSRSLLMLVSRANGSGAPLETIIINRPWNRVSWSEVSRERSAANEGGR